MMNVGALNWFDSFIITKLKKALDCINHMIYTCDRAPKMWPNICWQSSYSSCTTKWSFTWKVIYSLIYRVHPFSYDINLPMHEIYNSLYALTFSIKVKKNVDMEYLRFLLKIILLPKVRMILLRISSTTMQGCR